MNNTHLVIVNQDNQPIAVVKKDDTVIERIHFAVSRSTGNRTKYLSEIDFGKIPYTGSEIQIHFHGQEDSVSYFVFPTWVY